MPAGRMVLWLLFAGCARAQSVAPVEVRPGAAARVKAPRGEALGVRGEVAAVTFTPATSGTCEPMRLVAHGSETYLSYGSRGTFVRRLADGSLVDLSLHGVVPHGSIVVKVEAVRGDDMIVEVKGVDSADSGTGRFFRRHAGVWTALADDMQHSIDGLAPWLDGGVLASGYAYARDGGAWSRVRDLQAFAWTSAASALPAFAVEESVCPSEFEFTAETDGRILVSGRGCAGKQSRAGSSWSVVRWSPAGGGMRAQLAQFGDDWKPGPVAIVGPTRMLATAILGRRSAYRTIVASFDGTGWTLLPPADGGAEQIEVDAEERPWLRMSHGALVQLTADGRWVARTVAGASVRDFGGLRGAWAWVLADGGDLWVRPAGGEFARARLATGEFEPRQLRAEQVALVGDELWVTVGYDARQLRTLGIRSHPCVLLLRSATNKP